MRWLSLKLKLLLWTGLFAFVLPVMVLAASGEGEHPVNVMSQVFRWINFLVFVAIVYFAARGLVAKKLRSRREEILSLISEADSAVGAAEQKLSEVQARWENIGQEMDHLRNRLREEADQQAAEVIRLSEEHAKRLEENARKIVEFEKDRASKEIRDETIRRVVDSVLARLKAELTTEQDEAWTAAQLRRSQQELDETSGGASSRGRHNVAR